MFGALDSVLVEDPPPFGFDGAIGRAEARSVWTWLARDVAPDLVDHAPADGRHPVHGLEAITPALLARARSAIALAASDAEMDRRLKTQVGGPDVWKRLPVVLGALKCHPVLTKAEAFGRAINGIEDEATLTAALQSMPRQDAGVAGLLMMAAVRHVATPSRLIVVATQLAGGTSETALVRGGFAPLVNATLAHAHNAIPPLLQGGAFADIDLICRAVDRFHRLVRAISANVELTRPSRWAPTITALVKTVSDRLEPRLREALPDINVSLRRQREGADRLDSDRLLAALNGIYLLATVRDCRDSLALNEVFDECWSRTGQALELHLTRNLEALRAHPDDRIVAARLESGIKMAEIRFGVDYADVLRRARDTLGRHTPSAA